MNRLLTYSVVIFLACNATGASALDREEYIQTRCDVDDESAAIWMATPSDISKGNKFQFNVEFQPPGPVVRFPPQFYAPDWKDIDRITMEYPKRSANSGTLSLQVRETTGATYTQQIGLVRRDCWNKTKGVIKRMISADSPQIIERDKVY